MNVIEAKNRIAMLASITGRHDLTDELGAYITQQQAIIDQQSSKIYLQERLAKAQDDYIATLEKYSWWFRIATWWKKVKENGSGKVS